MFNDHTRGAGTGEQPGKTQIKRFVAPSMARALQLVRDEMGPEAVILSSQRTPNGVEVITSLEPDLPTRGIDVRREFGQNFDADLDHPMESDSAWKMQAGIDQAAASFKASASVDSRPAAAKKRDPEQLAMEIERARERMLAAKRESRDAPSDQSFHQFVKQQTQLHGQQPPQSHSPAELGPRERSQERPQARQQQQYASQPQQQPQHYQDQAGQPYSHASTQASHDAQVTPKEFNRYSDEPTHAVGSNAYAGAGNSANGVGSQGGPADSHRLNELQSELADMRLLLEQQLWHMNDSKQRSQMPSQINLPVGYSLVGDHLKRLGLSENLVQELLQQQDGSARPSAAWKSCLAKLSRRIPALKGDMVSSGGVFAFVGPTGVGKTTTIAKLAARFVLENGPGKVAIITTDTYRVGAHDQLRSLGRILGVPVRALDKDHSLPVLLASLKQFPLILVDTAGFRQGDALLKEQLRQLDTCPTMRRILVMACNSQLQTLKASVHAYAGQRGVDACVITKVDESLSMGEALSVLVEKSVPVAYTTDGQEIPKDISPASGHALIARAVAMAKEAQEAEKQGNGMAAL